MEARGPIRVACAGAGYFARFHHDAWRRIAGAELVAAIDRDIAKAEVTGCTAYSELAPALEEARPDLLDIITPPESHLEIIRQALDHGISTIICQKPFCGGLEDARRAVALAEAAGALLVVHENFRFQPWYRAIKREVDEGRIGKVLQVAFRLRPGDGQGADAYLDRQPYFRTMEKFLVHETGIHWIDTFRFLLGEPDGVYAELRRLNPAIAGEDAGYFIFSYASGARAVFDGNRLLDHAAGNCRLTMGEALVEGTKGTLSLSGDGAVSLRAFAGLEQETILSAKDYDGFGGDCVHALQAHVIEGLLRGTPIENRGADYLKNLELEEAVYRSSEKEARIVL